MLSSSERLSTLKLFQISSKTQMTLTRQRFFLEMNNLHVHIALAANPGLSEEVFEALSECDEVPVRRALAENPSITREVALKLARDTDPVTLMFLANNEGVTLGPDFPASFFLRWRGPRALSERLTQALPDLDEDVRNTLVPEFLGTFPGTIGELGSMLSSFGPLEQ